MSSTQKKYTEILKKDFNTLLIDPLIALANAERTDRSLENDAQFAERMKVNIDTAFTAFQTHLSKGSNLLKEAGIWPQERVEKRFSYLLVHRQEAEEELKKGSTLQTLLHLTDDELLLFYQEAMYKYQDNHNVQAEDLLLLLTYLNPLISSFWVALGAVQIKKQDFEAASYSHILGAELGDEYFSSYLLATECLLQLQYNDKAQQILERAKNRLGENPHFQIFRPQIEALFVKAKK